MEAGLILDRQATARRGLDGFGAINVFTVSPASITSSATLPICTPNTTTLSVSPAGFASYAWNTSATTPSITVSTGGTYSVLVTDANGCTQTPSLVVVINPSPTTAIASASGSTNLCWDGVTAASVILSADTTGAGAGASIAWNDFNGAITNTLTIDNNSFDFFNANPSIFNFTVTNSFGCTSTSNSITVTSDLAPTITALSTTTGCNGDSVKISGTKFTGATSVKFNGITSAFTVVNDGLIATTVPAGATTGTITVTSPLGICTATSGIFTVQCGNPMTINLTAFIQGYYVGAGMMQPVMLNQNVIGATATQADSIQVEIYNGTTFALAGSTQTVLMTNGTASATINASDGSYYIAIRHRNSVFTWSATPVTLASALPASYNFSTAPSQSFSGMAANDLFDGVYSIYTGDVNQDEFIDASDFPLFDTDNLSGACCSYLVTDFNGDGFVDASDFPVFDNNNLNGIFSIHP